MVCVELDHDSCAAGASLEDMDGPAQTAHEVQTASVLGLRLGDRDRIEQEARTAVANRQNWITPCPKKRDRCGARSMANDIRQELGDNDR